MIDELGFIYIVNDELYLTLLSPKDMGPLNRCQ